MQVRGIVREFFSHGFIKFGRFKLSSGVESPYYIDLRRLYSYPKLAREVAECLISIINHDYEGVAGVATAGIPLATYISIIKSIPMGYVRPAAKGHGTMGVVEGDLRGLKVLVVDDVATTGSSILSAVNALRSEGCVVEAAAVIIDREQGAEELLRSEGVKLYSLIKAGELFKELLNSGLIDRARYDEVMNYLMSFKGEVFK